MQSREDSLWESFPQAIQTLEGAGRYINAFRAPFQGLPLLSHQDVYVLQACSLLVIPPPAGRAALQGGFLTDLTGINLSDWAALVQDVAAGLQVLPPGLSNCLGPGVVNLLQLLEAATGVGFCHLCCNPEPHCRCVGVPQSAPLMSWNQILEQTPGYGMTSSAGGVTTPSTSLGGMPGLVPPPPELSIWNPFQGMAPIPWQPGISLPYKPPIGRADWLKAMLNERGLLPWAPQVAPAIHQPPLLSQSRPATLYQQTVHPPAKMMGLGVTFDSSTTKPAPTDSQDTDVHGRQATQGRDDGHWPASYPRGGREGSSIRTTNKLMPHQGGGHPAGVPHNIPPSSTTGAKRASTDPLENITNYRSVGWRKDLSHVLRGFYLYNYPSHMEAEWDKLKTKFLNHLGQRKEEWKTIKDEIPLKYMPYMEHQFLALTSVKLKRLSQFTGWIRPGSYYHGVVARKGQLHLCLHLAGTVLPRGPQICPSETQTLMQKKVDTPTTSHPTTGGEGSTTQGARSDPPIPMETGGVGDSWS